MRPLKNVIQQVLAGDTEAFGDVVEHYQGMLIAYASFRLPDRDSVDEIVQQTFIRAYEQLEQYRSEEDFGLWLRVLCRYCILAELKRRQREAGTRQSHRRQLKQWVLQRAAERVGSAESMASEALRECIEKLPAGMRELLKARYDEQRSVKELAQALQRSVTWVTTTIFRVRSLLRQCLAGKAAGQAQ